MIMVVGDELFSFDTAMMTAMGMRAKTNEFITMEYAPPTMVRPMVIAMVAPKLAPEDIPVVYGSARGFFRTLCMTHPHAASPAPVAIPTTMRGKRSSTTK